MEKVFVLMGLVAAAMLVTDAEAWRVTTNDGGADCELREEAPAVNRGTSTEIASRIYVYPTNPTDPTKSRNSMIYLKFNVTNITAADLLGDINVQTTYRNTNLSLSRLQRTDTLEFTGFDYYVLDPTLEGADWGETTITPSNAPGYYLDGNFLTKGVGTPDTPTDGMTYLGRQLFDSTNLQSGRKVVGDAFNFLCEPGSVLHAMIETAQQMTDHKTITVAMAIAHDQTCGYSQWLSFNYLFNPKEMATLNVDALSPYSGMSNATGYFSPALTDLPEPATMVLFGLGGLLLRRKR